MKLKNLLLFTLTLLLISANFLFAQKKINYKKLVAEAQEYMRVEEYHNAYALYKKIDSIKPDIKNQYQMGMLCVKMNKKEPALFHLKKAMKSAETFDKIYFYLGRAYHLNNQFDTAIIFYNMYKAGLKADVIHEDITPDDIDRFTAQCNVGKKLVKKPIDVKITNLGDKLNTAYHEFAPLISADETRLIFTSRRPTGIKGKDKTHGQSLEFHEDIYMSEKDENGEWKPAQRMSDKINSSGHDASIALSPDGQWLYLYRGENITGNNQMAGDIYYSVWEDSTWSEPKKMAKGINSKYWEPSASITENEMTFFFTSDRKIEGALGGRDIYVVKKLPNGDWAEPKNLGPPINTPYDEDGPFIHSNGRTLYYSSNSRNSMGGFDIFISHYNPDNDTWSEPQNLGYPINTAEDDIYFVWSADGVRGYFSSERDDSYGDTDLYSVSIPEKELNLIVVKGKIIDEDTKKPLGATIEVIDNKKQKTVMVSNSNEFNGRYTVVLPPNRDYGIRVGRNGYLFKSININIPDQFEYLEIIENIALKPISKGEINYEELNNMFFTQENDLRVESESELNRLKMLLDADPDLKIQIAVHTDNSQDSLVSLFMSQAKADALVSYLKQIGADDDRVEGVGYGSQYPIADNTTDEGRRENDRIEYITLSTPKEQAQAISYEAVRETIKQDTTKKEEQIVIKDVAPEEAKPGYILDLQHTVRFKLGTAQLDPSAAPAIEEILAYLRKYPKLVLEVGGHTDDIGDASYNQKLSEKRAGSVVQMLVFKGISRERFKIIGYGEEKPIAPNTTPEGRNKNRRTEFKAIKWD